MAITRVVDQSRSKHREASIAKSRCTWNGEESPQTPIYCHHSSRWLTLGPHQARMMASCHMPNDEGLRYAERCTVRRSTPDSIALVRLGRNHHERNCKRVQGRKITNSAVLELSCFSWKAYPKRGPRGCRIVVTAVVWTRQSHSKRHSAGEVDLEHAFPAGSTMVEANDGELRLSRFSHRGRGPVTLSLYSRQSISLTRLKCCYRRGRGPVFLRWMQGFYGYWYHHGRGPVMRRWIEQFG
jgi:hypothetical protein